MSELMRCFITHGSTMVLVKVLDLSYCSNISCDGFDSLTNEAKLLHHLNLAYCFSVSSIFIAFTSLIVDDTFSWCSHSRLWFFRPHLIWQNASTNCLNSKLLS